jgi:two-component system nitrate/nitrite response regulator NarL
MSLSTTMLTPSPAPGLPPPIRVMIVDDHPTVLWGLDKLINGEKPRMEVVGTAGTAEEALRCIGQTLPDIVLLDLDLDGTNGLDILPALLAHAPVRVLILTGERKETVLDNAVQKGARGILRKDASAEHVLKAIEKTHEGELWLDRSTLGRVFTGFMAPGASPKMDADAEMQASLTARERKIIEMIVEGQGASNKELAQRLFISEHTLRNHLTSIYTKLYVTNRLELYIYAVKHQLGQPDRGAGTDTDSGA